MKKKKEINYQIDTLKKNQPRATKEERELRLEDFKIKLESGILHQLK